jgi:hypothetical protein
MCFIIGTFTCGCWKAVTGGASDVAKLPLTAATGVGTLLVLEKSLDIGKLADDDK